MKIKILGLLMFGMIWVCVVFAQTGATVPNKLLISLHSEVKSLNPAGSNNKLGLQGIDRLNERFHCSKVHVVKRFANGGGVYSLTFAPGQDMQVLAQAYMRTGLCRYAEAVGIAGLGGNAPNDTAFYKQWALNNDGSFSINAKAGADIKMLQGWDIEDGDSNIIVAVVDAGCKLDHKELQGRIWMNNGEIPGNGIDDDGNDYIDDTIGWNAVYENNSPIDDNYHGTHVTGIIGANFNNITGISGVDHHCKLMIVKSADSTGFLPYDYFAEGIYYAADNGARVINISAGGPEAAVIKDAVDYALGKGAIIVAAMMNWASSVKCYPAAYPGVIAVGATDAADKRANFSNYGQHISVCAPGDNIISLSHLYDTAYVMVSGTSQATPHVSGLAALLLAQNPARTAAAVKKLIEDNADDMVGDSKDTAGFDRFYGYGRINTYDALTNASGVKKIKHAASAWKAYPNPATDNITVEGKYGYTLTLTNINGQTVYNAHVQNDTYTLPLTAYPRGSYILQLRNNEVQENIKLQLR